MNTKNNRRKRASRYKIENAFIQLIQERDVKEISITDLCSLAEVNRSTFYANYLDIYDLVDKIRERMVGDFKELYREEFENKFNSNNFLKLFYHIKENPLFYKTYFKLNFDANFDTGIYDHNLAQRYYGNEYIDYHSEFFKAGITAIIKRWISKDFDITPEELYHVIQTEYGGKELGFK